MNSRSMCPSLSVRLRHCVGHISLPKVCKTVQASGSIGSHVMTVAWNEDSLIEEVGKLAGVSENDKFLVQVLSIAPMSGPFICRNTSIMMPPYLKYTSWLVSRQLLHESHSLTSPYQTRSFLRILNLISSIGTIAFRIACPYHI